MTKDTSGGQIIQEPEFTTENIPAIMPQKGGHDGPGQEQAAPAEVHAQTVAQIGATQEGQIDPPAARPSLVDLGKLADDIKPRALAVREPAASNAPVLFDGPLEALEAKRDRLRVLVGDMKGLISEVRALNAILDGHSGGNPQG